MSGPWNDGHSGQAGSFLDFRPGTEQMQNEEKPSTNNRGGQVNESFGKVIVWLCILISSYMEKVRAVEFDSLKRNGRLRAVGISRKCVLLGIGSEFCYSLETF